MVGGQLRLRTAAEYRVRLRTPGGGKYRGPCHEKCDQNIIHSDLVRNLTLDGSVTSHDLRGLSLGAVYTVTLSCVFISDSKDMVTLPCGSRTVLTSVPDLLEADTVLRRLEVARSWLGSEAECLGGGGHLVSLGRDLDTEELIQERLGLSDWWTGGNICPDSPGELNIFRPGYIQTFIHITTSSCA